MLITGHTGFKGSWLALWLSSLGADVTGLSLDPPTTPNHWDLLGLDVTDLRVDVRDAPAVAQALRRARPEVVFHLAAQSLVRTSYDDPLATWGTNVMGTAHVLEACRQEAGVRAIVVVTSDKCYENVSVRVGYRESDPLGGHDPYSASKAGAELVAASYRRSFYHQPSSAGLATARAGNVIGGGDWSAHRLLPDLVRAVSAGQPLEVRSPQAVRPWQHVLESLSGYLLLGQLLLEGRSNAASAFNFGPPANEACAVNVVLEKLRHHWPELSWAVSTEVHPHEAALLQLDSAKARNGLGWQPVWSLDQALQATADWYRAYLSGAKLLSHTQLQAYVVAAAEAGIEWAQAS